MEKRLNEFTNPIRNCPRTETTKLVWNNYNEEFVPNRENCIKMLDKVFAANPHLKYKWESAEDYLNLFKCLPKFPLSWDWAEMYVVDELEMRNATWSFSNAEYYNPYWNMDKEEWNNLSREIEKMYG